MDQKTYELLKKFIVVSICLLSLFITLKLNLYKFTIQLVTHALDKNYMFLLCNILLLFIAMFSIFSSSKTFDYGESESYNATMESVDHGRGTKYFLAEEVTVNSSDEESKYQETQENEEDDDPFAEGECDFRDNEEEEVIMATFESVHGRGTECFLAEEVTVNSSDEESNYHETEENDEDDDPLADHDSEQEFNLRDKEEEEEMDKKFDEFIKKMKEELRIDAKRHLLLFFTF